MRKRKRKCAVQDACAQGQIAIEALIVIAFVLALMIPIFYILYIRGGELREELRLLQIKRAVDSLAASINVVGVLGPSGSATIELDLPEGISAITIKDKEIIFTTASALGPIDIPRLVGYEISGALTPSVGKKKIQIFYDEQKGKIILSEI